MISLLIYCFLKVSVLYAGVDDIGCIWLWITGYYGVNWQESAAF